MKLREQILGLQIDLLSLILVRFDFLGLYGDGSIRLFDLHKFWFFSIFVTLVFGDGPKVMSTEALTFLLFVENIDILFKDITSLVLCVLIGEEFIRFDKRGRISVIETINNFLDIGFGLISHTSMNFLIFLAWSQIHDLFICGTFMKRVWRRFVNRIISHGVFNSLNRSCRKFHTFICSESYINWRVFRAWCGVVEFGGGLSGLFTCGFWDIIHEVTVCDGAKRIIGFKCPNSNMVILINAIVEWRSVKGVAS